MSKMGGEAHLLLERTVSGKIDIPRTLAMSMTFRILGKAGRDNAVLVQVDSGQAVERLECKKLCNKWRTTAQRQKAV